MVISDEKALAQVVRNTQKWNLGQELEAAKLFKEILAKDPNPAKGLIEVLQNYDAATDRALMRVLDDVVPHLYAITQHLLDAVIRETITEEFSNEEWMKLANEAFNGESGLSARIPDLERLREWFHATIGGGPWVIIKKTGSPGFREKTSIIKRGSGWAEFETGIESLRPGDYWGYYAPEPDSGWLYPANFKVLEYREGGYYEPK